MEDVKMMIVVRNDLNMRKGKIAAQAAHAATSFLIEKINKKEPWNDIEIHWLNSGAKKICVKAESEEDLLKIYDEATDIGLRTSLVIDSGLTEFKGVPTKTCLALGPDISSKLDQITGDLGLM